MRDSRTGDLRVVLLVGVLVTTIGLVGYGATAMAQEQQQVEKTQVKEEVVVTGTLIPRPTLEAMSPVATLDVEALSYRGTTRIEDLLNSLPQVFAAQNSTVSNGSSGTATVDLRYLGTNRTLVLIDGRRMSGGDAFATAPDLNFIPSALVKRVDILTGGASATYGADAVAGVVNFILDKDFEGVRGGISFGGYGHKNNNQAVYDMNAARGFTAPTGQAWDGGQFDANVALGGKFAEGKGHASVYLDYRTISALQKGRRDYTNCSVLGGMTMAGPTCGGSSTSPTGRFWTDDGKSWTVDPATGNTFTKWVSSQYVFNYAPYNFMQRPDQRFTGGGFANYQWNEHAEGYLSVMLMDDYTDAQIAPSGDFGNTFLINCDNPMMSEQQRKIACTDNGYGPTDDAGLQIYRRNIEGGGRVSQLRHTSFRLLAGLKGEINKTWSYDVYGLDAEVHSPQGYANDLNVNRIQESLFVVGNPSDESTWRCRNAAAVAEGCVPWNVFKKGGVTQAALGYLQLPEQLDSGVKTQLVSGEVHGDLKDWGLAFPSATEGLQLALGAAYRKEFLYVKPDLSFQMALGAGSGGPTLPVSGNYSVKEGYAELLVPIVQGASMAKDLSLELGYRYSDYSTSGGWNTYKAQAAWAPGSALKFRAGLNRATRAANVSELFTPQGIGLNGSNDPCAGEIPSFTPEQCARMGVSAAQYGHVAENSANQYNTLGGGNPNLTPEVADTTTYGIVITPGPFTAALDYYNIKIKSTIGSLGADDILNQCGVTGDPALCSLIHRDRFGTLWRTSDGYTITTNQNIGELGSEGIDVNASYTLPAGNSFFSFSLMGTYLLASTINTGLYSYDCVGFFGNQCGVPTPTWRHFFRASWETGPVVLSLGWRMLGAVKNDDLSSNPAIGDPGNVALLAANNIDQIPAYNYLDLAFSFKMKAGIQFTLGCNNVTDKAPPLGPGMSPNDYGAGFYNTYDSYGRYVFSSVQFTF